MTTAFFFFHPVSGPSRPSLRVSGHIPVSLKTVSTSKQVFISGSRISVPTAARLLRTSSVSFLCWHHYSWDSLWGFWAPRSGLESRRKSASQWRHPAVESLQLSENQRVKICVCWTRAWALIRRWWLDQFGRGRNQSRGWTLRGHSTASEKIKLD